MKLWGGRFKKDENKFMEDFNNSLSFDKRLYREDISGSIAHARMLAKCGILTLGEGEAIESGLNSILEDLETGVLKIEGSYEDIHSFVESILIERIGDTGKKLHTARSRNDQVALDMRLFARGSAEKVIEAIDKLAGVIKKTADENHVIMPGYTHLQRAQVVTFKHHMMAYYSMLERDRKRVCSAMEVMDESPLGCGALAGTTYEIDREYTAVELGFAKPVDNFLDGVSDKDFLLELMACFSIIMMHLSRLSEELIIWSSQEFKFIEIADEYSTGSSIMPQKKNPDGAELVRGKTGRVYGALLALLTTMKGLPLSYNKDMQEDKEQFFDSLDTVLNCLEIMSCMISTLKVRADRMRKAVKEGFLNATEVADYLVNRGMAFRDAHGVVGTIVLYCEENSKSVEELRLEELQKFSLLFEEDIYDFINYDNILKKGIKNII